MTTTSITAVSESMRSAHSECRSPKLMNENSVTRASWPAKPTSKKANQDSTQEITRNVVVMSIGGQRAGGRRLVGFMLLGVRIGERRVRAMRMRRRCG